MHGYSDLISSVPLPEIIPLIDGVAEDARQAAIGARLLRQYSSTSVFVAVIFPKPQSHPEVSISRVNLPHVFSAQNAPPGCGSIQAEIYFSRKYKPLQVHPDELMNDALDDLRQCGFIRSAAEIVLCATAVNRYANIIYDTDRAAALRTVHGFLHDLRIHYCGRYGRWNHAWTDQAFVDGERTAHEVVGKCQLQD